MDHVKLEEQNVVERYLLGQLDPEEATRFEQHYLDCPRCLERLEVTKVLHDGLRSVAAEEGARTGAAVLLWAWWRQRGRLVRSGLVAALAVIVISPWALVIPRLLEGGGPGGSTQAPRAGTAVLALSPERSAPGELPSTVLTLRPEPEWVVLNLLLPGSHDRSEVADWRIHLTRDEHEVWSGPVQTDGSGHVALSVHSSWLEPSVHQVELVQVGPDGVPRPVTTFAFVVRLSEPREQPLSPESTQPQALEANLVKKTFTVVAFDGTRSSRRTVLHEGSTIELGEDDGWVRIIPGGLWDIYPPCKPFDYIGIALMKGDLPEIWYSIQMKDGGLEGALYVVHPCDGSFPSAIATWEAEEETPDL